MAYKLGFALDVKAIKYVSDSEVKTIDVGWTFLPIYSILANEDGTQSIYTNSGLYMVRVYILLNIFLVTAVHWSFAQRHIECDQLKPG